MIISRYIGKSLISATVAITLVLLLVIVSSRFVDYLADAASGEIPASLLGQLLLYKLPGFFQLILPLGFFIAVMLTYGQLYVDSEMVVLQACGYSQWRLLRTAWMPTLVVALVVAYCSLVVSPAGEAKLKAEMEKPSASAGFSTLVAGKFQYVGNGFTVYVQGVNDEKTAMKEVFLIHEYEENGASMSVIAMADRAQLQLNQGIRYLVLFDGYQFKMQVGSLERSQTQFGELAIKLVASKQASIRPASVDALPTEALWQDPTLKNMAALHWRLATPVMVFIAAIIGFSLSRTTHRKGRYGKLLPGIVLFFIYFTAATALRGQIETGKVHPLVGLWPLHGLMLVIGLTLLWGGQVYQRWLRQLFVKNPPMPTGANHD